MQTYKITIIQPNGKIRTEHIEACTPEMAVRSLMCWYSVGTRFDVDGKSFEITRTSNKISGYTDLKGGKYDLFCIKETCRSLY